MQVEIERWEREGVIEGRMPRTYPFWFNFFPPPPFPSPFFFSLVPPSSSLILYLLSFLLFPSLPLSFLPFSLFPLSLPLSLPLFLSPSLPSSLFLPPLPSQQDLSSELQEQRPSSPPENETVIPATRTTLTPSKVRYSEVF